MDAVIKVGGSLTEYPAALRELCAKIGDLAKKFRLIVVPGGGKFADVVREMDREFALPNNLSHRMAILGMDQYGLALSSLIPNACVFNELDQAPSIAEAKLVPVFLPSQLLLDCDPFEPSWNVTSDSIAAYVAVQAGATKLILVTDVDGIFTKNPKEHSNTKLLKHISTEELASLTERTSVDRALPHFLFKNPLRCYAVNGKYPERVEALLAGQETASTLIENAPK